MTKVKRALVSVFDKKGVLDFAKGLHSLGIEILSTGGTAELLRNNGVPVREVSEVTQFPEMLDGRVKTLHPKLHAGLLALRDNPKHQATLKEHDIQMIDLVAVNLYPFWDAVKNKTQEEEIIEMIDIGGPAMLRSASKNFRSVAVVCDPADYERVLQELRKGNGSVTPELRRELAGKVFAQTAAYDTMIAAYFAKSKKVSGSPDSLPAKIDVRFEKVQDLRYGENPHQKGALYRDPTAAAGVVGAKQLHGKELSFNNFLDLDAALEMVLAFKEPACSIVKHTSPCGFALGKNAKTAFRSAYLSDPLSAFGSIVGFNTTVDADAAKQILRSGFIECIIAESFSKDALTLLQAKKNLRLLAVSTEWGAGAWDFKKVSGGLLLQDRDEKDPSAQDLRVVTKKKPTTSQIRDLLFAFKVCRYVKSNAIVIAKHNTTLGLGMGQPSRVDSCEVAFKKAGKRAKGAILASDGFFPKPDSIALAKKHGISAIIQPGGSIQDEPVIEACNKAKIAMVFTGVRHFKH